MKAKTVFFCTECGSESPKWSGRCAVCGAWNSMVEQPAERPAKSGKTPRMNDAVKASAITTLQEDEEIRFPTGMGELDRVLGGGLVRGSIVLLGGEPGIGKSTLLLQICQYFGKEHTVLYVSGEESASQIKIRAERLGVHTSNLLLMSETDVETILNAITDTRPDIVIIDSIQTMHIESIASASGSVPQVRETTNALMRIAKSMSISMFIVGHVTKDGSLAGPRVLEHMVDCVLYFEGDRQLSFRILRAVKNRFGSTNETGVFEMCDKGLEEVENPSKALLEGRPENISGSAIICAMEGSRGILAEIQALVTPTGFGNPRRMSAGIDMNRVLLLIAVLEKRARMNLSNSDVYINVAGGLKIDETAAGLGICAAIAASQSDTVLPSDMIFIGEVGLGGELRSVSQLEKRLTEAANLGFKTVIAPKQSLKGVRVPEGIKLFGVRTIGEAMKLFRG